MSVAETVDRGVAARSDAPNRLMITLIAMSATVMQVLDTTIANVALPHMQGTLGATQDQIAWVLTSYIVASAIATPATGWVAARLGRTRAFTLALAGFTLTSIACGMATTLPQIVLFRVLQGAFGAVLVPMSQAILLDAYPRSEMARAMGIFSAGVMIGPILGPILGGYLTEDLNWRWCFYINVPIGILAVTGALIFVPETARAHGRKLDWLGFGFLSLAIASLQLVLDRGEQLGWLQSPEILVETALSIFGLYMFVVHSATTRNPFIDIRLFRDITFMTSTIITAAVFMVYLGALVLSPQLLQLELNYPVATAGLVTSPRGLGMMAAVVLVGRFGRRIGPRAMIAIGMLANGVALYLMSRWSLSVSTGQIVWTAVIQGFGMGLISLPAATVAFATLPNDLRNDGTAFFSLMRNLGGSVGVALVASRIVELTQIQHGHLAAFFTPYSSIRTALMTAKGAAAARMLNLELTHQAGMVAYINGFLLLGLMSVAMLPLVLFLRAPRAPKPAAAAPAIE